MDETGSTNGTRPSDYDAVIVGGSLAGCTTAILLGRAGQRVAVVEKQPDPEAFKRMCSHFIQASAVPTIERLDLLEPIMEAGGVRSRIRAWTPWGELDPPKENSGYAVNLRRETLDPMVREAAAATPGVDLYLGHAATGLTRGGEAFDGVTVRTPEGEEKTLRARLVVGADGRDSKVVKLAEVKEKTHPHGRFAYGSYFEGPPIEGSPDGKIWFADPHWAAAFPTDSGLTFYAAMPTMELLPEFKRDPEAALISFISKLPEPPPIHEQRRVDDVVGKIDMTNRVREQVAPGLALVGDAALATDPLFGVGCGWAFESGEWLADSVIPALRGEESLERGLKRYRRLHRRKLAGHAFLIHDYATGRPVSRPERMLFRAASRDPKLASRFDAFATRRIGPARMFATTVPRAMLVNARHALRRGGEDLGGDGNAVGAQRDLDVPAGRV
jgi:2-polyprenyl-6-methoxyphenol hydroxylase-like FAD-dependent oxidoreductase